MKRMKTKIAIHGILSNKCSNYQQWIWRAIGIEAWGITVQLWKLSVTGPFFSFQTAYYILQSTLIYVCTFAD